MDIQDGVLVEMCLPFYFYLVKAVSLYGHGKADQI